MNKIYGFIILFVISTIHSATALYFHIGETERKCFIEEIPDETNVIINYKVELYDPEAGVTCLRRQVSECMLNIGKKDLDRQVKVPIFVFYGGL
ncbi:hypothetical protein FQR65_LT08822 [Abscondita terminalis]|nr:hypothetical protein FQR65_LT08822 [Abscondita terminalis]